VDKLSRNDIASATWQKLAKHLARRIDDLRAQNDGQLSELDTARLRGRIAEIKQILSLAEDLPAQSAPVIGSNDQ
jgi:hypothetical protein